MCCEYPIIFALIARTLSGIRLNKHRSTYSSKYGNLTTNRRSIRWLGTTVVPDFSNSRVIEPPDNSTKKSLPSLQPKTIILFVFAFEKLLFQNVFRPTDETDEKPKFSNSTLIEVQFCGFFLPIECRNANSLKSFSRMINKLSLIRDIDFSNLFWRR